MSQPFDLRQAVEPVMLGLEQLGQKPISEPSRGEFGTLTHLASGVARATGLARVGSEELVRLGSDCMGFVCVLDPEEIGIVLLDQARDLKAGSPVFRTGEILSTPVGTGLFGRMVDPLGRPLDDLGPLLGSKVRPIESPAPAIMDRSAVERPLQTGIKVIDALLPIGRGQRELILGDRQTGKTSLALDTILHQKGKGVFCIYCSIGQRDSSVAAVRAELEKMGALEYTCIVVARPEDPPGVQYLAPYAATAIGEEVMAEGKDALIVYDDLTHHARAYRELSLLLRRPPGREAYPGDIFYIHSRLLERTTQLKPELGGGSLTALPIASLEGEGLAAYIPTNLISITDGQIVLSPQLFQKGALPAVDVGRSVSRVGGDAQLSAYRSVVKELRLRYAQFEELEAFARFDTRMSSDTQATLERGRRIRAVLKQPRYETLDVVAQLISMLALNLGLFDAIPLEEMVAAEKLLHEAVLGEASASGLSTRVEKGESFSDSDRSFLESLARKSLSKWHPSDES